MRRTLFSLFISLLLACTLPARAETQLVMVEEPGCIWCARWNAEVSPEYPLTAEGRAAPLRRIDLRAPVPDDLALDGPLRLTPTFILVIDGHEVSRLEGYPGEDFFWGLLARMLTNAGVELDDGA